MAREELARAGPDGTVRELSAVGCADDRARSRQALSDKVRPESPAPTSRNFADPQLAPRARRRRT
ncbi:hypothetical protein ASG72_15385 [Bosea sp. Leaf344]|nr:hypothetical protein ASG72_15385 [Bosea sp. Leaf344]